MQIAICTTDALEHHSSPLVHPSHKQIYDSRCTTPLFPVFLLFLPSTFLFLLSIAFSTVKEGWALEIFPLIFSLSFLKIPSCSHFSSCRDTATEFREMEKWSSSLDHCWRIQRRNIIGFLQQRPSLVGFEDDKDQLLHAILQLLKTVVEEDDKGGLPLPVMSQREETKGCQSREGTGSWKRMCCRQISWRKRCNTTCWRNRWSKRLMMSGATIGRSP